MADSTEPAPAPPPGFLQISFSPARMFRLGLYYGLAGLSGATLLGFLAEKHWTLELFTHFKTQYAFGAVMLTSLFLMSRAWYSAAICGVLAVWHLAGVAIFYLPAQTTPVDGPQLRILVANVLGSNQEKQPFLDFVRDTDPDIILVQEVQPHWAEALELLHEAYPYHRVLERTDMHGMAQYSRVPLEYLPPPKDLGLPLFISRVTIEEREFILANVHTTPPFNPDSANWRNVMLDRLQLRLAEETLPLVVAGDFNTTPWSPYYKRFVKGLKLINAQQGFGVVPTWSTNLRRYFVRIPLDYALVSPEIGVVQYTRGPDIGSDHFPIVVDLQLPFAR